MVFLDPDVAEVFTDSAAVNQALRQLMKLAKAQVSATSRPKRRRSRRAAHGAQPGRESGLVRRAAERQTLTPEMRGRHSLLRTSFLRAVMRSTSGTLRSVERLRRSFSVNRDSRFIEMATGVFGFLVSAATTL